MYEFRKQVHEDDQYKVTFKEVDSDVILDYAKDGEPYYLILLINVYDKIPTSVSVNSFIRSFLADPKGRDQFARNGSWNGVINLGRVYPSTERMIRKINAKEEKDLRFKDFAALRTHGIDGFSRKSEDELLQLLEGKDLTEIDSLEDKKLRLTAYKWVARGLREHYAYRKVLTDAEIERNARSYR